jgi:Protein of unknown function (DUF3050).
MIKNVKKEIVTIQNQLNKHPLYTTLNSIENITYFMTHHMFCVWDFMNLLKTLQIQFTCVSLPWRPNQHTHISRLINEIVLEEESDQIDGKATSRFSYYIQALLSLDHENDMCHQF